MGMRIEKKKEIAESLRAELKDAGAVFLADFTGLDVESLGELRGRLVERGAGLRVVKNTLTLRALEGLDYPDLREHLKGPTALVLGGDDPVTPAKVVREFAQEHENRPVVKVGVVDRREIAAPDVDRLAATPPRELLLGAIAGGLTAPVAGIVGALEALIRDIAWAIEQVARRGEAEA